MSIESISSVTEHVDQAEVVELAAALSNIPSFSGEEGPVGRFTAERMRQLGFDGVELQEVESGRFNVIGTMRGDGSGVRFMFNGHLDVDPLPIGYDRTPWTSTIENGWLYAVGVGNMKGADAAMIMAAAAVKRAGIALRGDIVVACVVGELQGGVGTKYLLDNGELPDVAIVPEPTNLQIRTMHAGVLEALVTVRHKPGTTRGNPIESALKAMRAMHALEFTHRPYAALPGLPRMHVGSVLGGKVSLKHRGPADFDGACTMAIDVRLHPDMEEADVVADLQRCLAALANDDTNMDFLLEPPPAAYRAPWRSMGLYMPPLDLPSSHPLVGVTARWHERITGEAATIGMHMPGSYAGADSGHLWRRGVPCFNYGPSQHSRFFSEVSLSNLETGAKVMALTAAELCSKRREDVLDDPAWSKRST